MLNLWSCFLSDEMGIKTKKKKILNQSWGPVHENDL